MFRYMRQVCNKEMFTKSSLNIHAFRHNKWGNKWGARRFKKVVDDMKVVDDIDIEERMKWLSVKEKKAAFKELVKRTEGLSAEEEKAAFIELVKRTEKI